MTSETSSRTMARGKISMPMLRIVNKQKPANKRDAGRQTIHIRVALHAAAARQISVEAPTATIVAAAQTALPSRSSRMSRPLVPEFNHPTVRTTGRTLSAILSFKLPDTQGVLPSSCLTSSYAAGNSGLQSSTECICCPVQPNRSSSAIDTTTSSLGNLPPTSCCPPPDPIGVYPYSAISVSNFCGTSSLRTSSPA